MSCTHNVCMCLDTVLIHATSIITVCHYPIMFRTLNHCFPSIRIIYLLTYVSSVWYNDQTGCTRSIRRQVSVVYNMLWFWTVIPLISGQFMVEQHVTRITGNESGSRRHVSLNIYMYGVQPTLPFTSSSSKCTNR